MGGELNHVQVGISMRPDLFQKIEKDRGDVTRSRFITRLIEQAYAERERMKLQKQKQQTDRL